jgi:hypothetical protein
MHSYLTVDRFPTSDTSLSITRLAAHPKFVWFSRAITMLETFIITLYNVFIKTTFAN